MSPEKCSEMSLEQWISDFAVMYFQWTWIVSFCPNQLPPQNIPNDRKFNWLLGFWFSLVYDLTPHSCTLNNKYLLNGCYYVTLSSSFMLDRQIACHWKLQTNVQILVWLTISGEIWKCTSNGLFTNTWDQGRGFVLFKRRIYVILRVGHVICSASWEWAGTKEFLWCDFFDTVLWLVEISLKNHV